MKTTQTLKQATMRVAALVVAIAAPSAFAASQTWSPSPVSGEWSTAANWVGAAVPGQATLNNSAQNTDVITFNSPISGGFGGASTPFRNSDTNRQVRLISFDTVGCGAYVLTSSNGYTFGISATLNTLPGGAVISAAVTNAQIIEHLTTRLQSSQNGAIGFTNNSTTLGATLTLNRLTNSSASTRPMVITLAGSNTGDNTINNIYDNAGANGAILIDKIDAGKWILSGANELPQKTSASVIARLSVQNGTLVVRDAASLGSITAGNLTVSNGVLQVDNVSPLSLGITVRNGGVVRMNGSGTVNGITIANQAGNSATLATTSAGDVFTVGGIGVNTGGLADSTLTTTGSGSVIFNIASTYIGKYVFSAATNVIQLATSLGNGPNAHISAGSVLDMTPQGAASYTLTTAAISANGSGTAIGSTAATITADPGATFDIGNKPVALSFAPTAFTGDTTHPSLYVASGTLSLGGNTFTVNNTSGTPLGAGTYRIVQQATGSITSGGSYSAIVTGSGLAPLGVASIVITGGNIDLVVAVYVPQNLSWKGGNPDATWDLNTTANFDNAGAFSVYKNPDVLTFGALGSANPTVTLVGSLAPGSVTVDTAVNDYTFTGLGAIAGTTSLTKNNAGVLTLGIVNTYQGGTTVNGGTVRVGVNDAISSSGAGNVAVQSPAVIDLNNFNNSINGLSGTGTVDNQGGAASTLTVGNNNASSTFSGLLTNTSGTLALTKAGNGTLTLPGAQRHSGPTTINAGTLEVQNANSLGFGLSPVALNGGALRTTTSINVNSLTGVQASSVANAAGAGATIITHTGAGNYTGVISDGASGTVGVYVASGTLQLNGNSTYSGGTVVASGATLAVGVINPGGSGIPGAGGITASNNAVISLPTTVSTAAAPGNNITNVEATGRITLSCASQGNSYNGLFIGGANSTNVFVGPGSIGGATSFANFLGTVVFTNGSSWRWFNGNGGGDSTTFIVESGANMFSRDANMIRLGALLGAGGIGNPSVSAPATYLIGAKGLSTTFTGTVNGTNNIAKVGAGSLTLNGIRYYTNTVTLPDTSVVDFTLFSNAVAYAGSTTVSNGTLTIVAPNNLTNSPSITLAGGTLDVSSIGYLTNQTTLDISAIEQPTNTVVVTTSTLDILSGQSLNGNGNITGSVNAQAGSTVNVGQAIGTLAVSGSVSLNGTVNMNVNATNSPNNSDRITAASFSGAGATLNVTDTGSSLTTGTVCQLFSGAVTAFSTVNLPVSNINNTVAYTWTNMISINGTIKVLSGASAVATNPTNITSTVTGGGTTLTLAWPASHIGWTLQNQTNSINVGISGTWFDVAGSAVTNQVIVPIVPGNPTVFYRLKL